MFSDEAVYVNTELPFPMVISAIPQSLCQMPSIADDAHSVFGGYKCKHIPADFPMPVTNSNWHCSQQHPWLYNILFMSSDDARNRTSENSRKNVLGLWNDSNFWITDAGTEKDDVNQTNPDENTPCLSITMFIKVSLDQSPKLQVWYLCCQNLRHIWTSLLSGS